jgi:glutathione synthase/RimK-type ligase-like ATP-grasp enzyme
MLTLYTNSVLGRGPAVERGAQARVRAGKSEAVMLILLSDGAGLTARQCATVLARAGHQVEALCPAGLCLGRMTRHVRRVHDVPALGRDPFGWLEAALDVATRRGAGLLLPVQEQVAVMSLARDRIEAAGLATAVPGFAALAQVQDKVSAFRTLARVGVPQPPALVAATAAEIEAAGAELAGAELAGAGLAGWPLFVKMPIGTASAGVRRAGSPDELRQVAADFERLGAFGPDGVLVQQPVAGPLAMVQAVFARGELVAFGACERVREGAAGGASHKLGLDLPEAREHMTRLGAALGWHGALSADVILGPDGPRFIDINPRLVEPVNALACGVDLAGALVEVARSGSARSRAAPPAAAPGARTHQLLLAVLGAAQQGSRRGVARELVHGVLRRGDYRGSREELTPGRGDPLAPLPVAATALATLIRPDAWRHFVGGSAGAYSLTPAAWRQILEAAAEHDGGPGAVEPGLPPGLVSRCR